MKDENMDSVTLPFFFWLFLSHIKLFSGLTSGALLQRSLLAELWGPYVGSKQGQLHAKQAPYLLYCHSSLSFPYREKNLGKSIL